MDTKQPNENATEFFIFRLKKLLEREKAEDFDLMRWIDYAQELSNFLATNELSIPISEEIWHYLSDIDIRIKKTEYEYAESQRNFVIEYIQKYGSRHS